MRAMDPMLSEVYSSTNHLLSNYFMDNVLQDAVPPKALNLFGTKIIVKLEGLPSVQNKCRHHSREGRLKGLVGRKSGVLTGLFLKWKVGNKVGMGRDS